VPIPRERRQIIDVANTRKLTLVEIGAGLFARQIVRVDKVRIGAVRRIIDRVTVSVGDSKN
jgi:hypothetical protein